MIKHVVCFKLTEDSAKAREKAREVLTGMAGNVPQLRGIEVHVDTLRTPRSFDVMLEVLVDDWAALDAYQKDPYHCSVVKTHMHAVAEKSIAMDFEV